MWDFAARVRDLTEIKPRLKTLLFGRSFLLKPQIYKVGTNWILWVPGVRVYRFSNWNEALSFALNPASRQTEPLGLIALAAASGN